MYVTAVVSFWLHILRPTTVYDHDHDATHKVNSLFPFGLLLFYRTGARGVEPYRTDDGVRGLGENGHTTSATVDHIDYEFLIGNY